jgi:mannose-6-phosphate isomerase-like protein (cupin superfamily)
MKQKTINITEKFDLFSDLWSPKVVAEMNNYQFKIAKVKGEFVWHSHDDTDETFIIIEGKLTIEFRDSKVELKKGEMFIVPKGKEHKPIANSECQIMLIEPKGVVNTGNTVGERTAENNIWI